jgi:hypothetical protein
MATYLAPFIRIQAFGLLYANEAWSFTLNVGADGGPPVAPTQAQADAVGGAIRSLFETTAFISQRAALTGVKLARIGTDGHYMDAKPTEYAAGGASGIGGGGSINPAPQVALAVTLEGPNPRAAAGRGRFYLPAPSFVVTADGRIGEADAQAVADRVGTLVNTINGQFSGRVAIVGSSTATGRGPAVQPVTAVAVGRVLDTIRSRRTSMPEGRVYSDTALTDGA